MAYNQLRANIRNAMVPMTVSEALAFRKTHDHAETVGYIDEFIQELRDELNDGEPFHDEDQSC